MTASQQHLLFYCISSAKSLPLHCVVESVPSIQASFAHDTRSPWRRRPNIETDSYVIIPAVTPFCDIVTVALQRLGYSSDISNTARGKFIINFVQTIKKRFEHIITNPFSHRLNNHKKLEAIVFGQNHWQHYDFSEWYSWRIDFAGDFENHNHSNKADTIGRN